MNTLRLSHFYLDRRLRFLLAGGFAAGINLLARIPLNAVMPFALAVIFASIIGMVVGFFTYRAFVFKGSERHIALQLRDFIMVNIGGTAVTAIVAVAARDYIFAPLDGGQVGLALAHALGILAGAAANYMGHARITFRDAV